jgi:carbamoyltransferase
MRILGISAFYHDSAAAIIENDNIIAAAQEERFTRKKHDANFPTNAIKFCLEYSGTSMNDIDAIAFYDKPFLKFERLLETYYNFAPKGIKSFIMAIPVWLKEKLFLKKIIRDELIKIEALTNKKVKILFPEHHLSHAASTYYVSPFEEAAILTIDGVGEWSTASISHGKGNSIEIKKELHFPHSLGLLYSAFTYYLGFRVNSGEYKLMGLAPYGNPNSEQTKKFIQTIKEKLVTIFDDGSIHLNQKYFNYPVGLTMVNEKSWEKLFGFSRRKGESEIEQHHGNLAFAIQSVTEELVLKMAHEAKRLTGSKFLCLAGGVALNCVANGKLLKTKIFDDIFIQPASGDAGGALGAAFSAYHIFYNQSRNVNKDSDKMQGAYLGPEFSEFDTEKVIRSFKAKAEKLADNELFEKTSFLLEEGNVVGWFQGKMEFGPRALGNRSILGDARNPEMQKKLNLKIKYRESFRPFAPSVLFEDSNEFFDSQIYSPYMLLVTYVDEKRQKELPKDYNELSIKDKLYFQRSDVPAITHLDFSARIQTVHKETNPKYWNLISKFKERTGYGIIVNTSFNVRGEPIVCTPEEAYRCFMRTEMDYLVVGNYIFAKSEQPEWEKTDNWKEEFVLD